MIRDLTVKQLIDALNAAIEAGTILKTDVVMVPSDYGNNSYSYLNSITKVSNTRAVYLDARPEPPISGLPKSVNLIEACGNG